MSSFEKHIKTSGKVLLSQIEAEHSFKCDEIAKGAVEKAVAKLNESNNRLRKALDMADAEMKRQDKRVDALSRDVAQEGTLLAEEKELSKTLAHELRLAKDRIGMYQRRVDVAERNAYSGGRKA